MYWHVGAIMFSPYMCCFRPMALQRIEEVGGGMTFYHFDAIHTSLFDLLAFQSLEVENAWSVEWLRLSNSARAVDTFSSSLRNELASRSKTQTSADVSDRSMATICVIVSFMVGLLVMGL